MRPVKKVSKLLKLCEVLEHNFRKVKPCQVCLFVNYNQRVQELEE